MRINMGGAIEKGIWGFFVAVIIFIIVFPLLGGKIASSDEYWASGAFVLTWLAFIFWGAASKPKESEKTVSTEGLTSRERIEAILLSITYVGAIGISVKYYKMRKEYPVKARELNRIVWLTLLGEFVVLISLALFLEWALPKFFGNEVYEGILRWLN